MPGCGSAFKQVFKKKKKKPENRTDKSYFNEAASYDSKNTQRNFVRKLFKDNECILQHFYTA